MEHGQVLYDRGLPDSMLTVNGFLTRRECVKAVVHSAINTNMMTPPKWMFWRSQWPEDVMAEYEKQAS